MALGPNREWRECPEKSYRISRIGFPNPDQIIIFPVAIEHGPQRLVLEEMLIVALIKQDRPAARGNLNI
jgi:hypothetical protein